MCILFIAIEQHPHYPLIIAANRDERFERPSRSAHHWPDAPDVYGGRDVQAGGSWLAAHRSGKLVAITNLRMPELYLDEARSRGEWVRNFFDSQSDAAFRAGLQAQRRAYNPFNLLFGTLNRLSVYNSALNQFTELAPGFHSISNGPIDDYWPKMSRGVGLLEAHVRDAGGSSLDTERLFQDMLDTTLAEDSQLPNTGVGEAAERLLSSIFIQGDEYGTRTTSLLCYDGSTLQFHERNYGPLAQPLDRSMESILVPPR